MTDSRRENRRERGYARDWHDDSDEWEMEGQDETRSAFDIFDDVNDDGE